jgi:hypothetical protein
MARSYTAADATSARRIPLTALRIRVDPGAGETTASFASRLAAANRLRAQDFCLDWGIETAVAAIAAKGGVNPDE